MASQLLTLNISIIILSQTVYSAISLINGNSRRSKYRLNMRKEKSFIKSRVTRGDTMYHDKYGRRS